MRPLCLRVIMKKIKEVVLAYPYLCPRCTFLGRCLGGGAHAIGEPWRFALHTADGHGNARAAGGEAVAVEVAGPAGTAVTAAAVADCGNGCYAVAFEPDRAGRWALTPR